MSKFTRRGFLGLLAGIPLLGKLAPEAQTRSIYDYEMRGSLQSMGRRGEVIIMSTPTSMGNSFYHQAVRDLNRELFSPPGTVDFKWHEE